MGLLVDMGGDDLVVNNIITGATGPGATSGSILNRFEPQTVTGLTASSTSQTIFLNDTLMGTFKVVAVAAVFGTASSSGTLQVEVCTGTQALAGGTNQLTGTVSLAGTANTTVNGTVIAAPTTITAGARLNIILGGTLTSLANGVVTVTLQRIS